MDQIAVGGHDFRGADMVDAWFAADAIGDVLRGGDETAAWSRFHERRDEHAIEDYQSTTDLARDLSRLLA